MVGSKCGPVLILSVIAERLCILSRRMKRALTLYKDKMEGRSTVVWEGERGRCRLWVVGSMGRALLTSPCDSRSSQSCWTKLTRLSVKLTGLVWQETLTGRRSGMHIVPLLCIDSLTYLGPSLLDVVVDSLDLVTSRFKQSIYNPRHVPTMVSTEYILFDDLTKKMSGHQLLSLISCL